MFRDIYEPEWFEQMDNDIEFIQSLQGQCSSCANGYQGQDGEIFCELRCKNVKPFENCPEWEEKEENDE